MFNQEFSRNFRMVGPSAVERAVDPVPGGARRTLGIPGVSCGSSKKKWAFKKGKINGGYLAGGCDKYEAFECK